MSVSGVNNYGTWGCRSWVLIDPLPFVFIVELEPEIPRITSEAELEDPP